MKNPWVKLWRNVLNDEKVSFILRRYGHDCLTFWIGMLTKCEEGVLVMDEEIFADLCLLETKRYEEIRGIFIKRGLIVEDGMHRLAVVNWDEYQVGESTERVRKFRDKQREASGAEGKEPSAMADRVSPAPVTAPFQETPCNGDVTACNEHETGVKRLEGEGEVDREIEKEGEEERVGARGAPHPAVMNPKLRVDPSGAILGAVPELATPRKIVQDWFEALSQETWTNALPPPKAEEWAKPVVELVRGDIERAKRIREEYFAHWRELWFAVSKGQMDLPEDKRAPDFDFRMYCIQAVALAARLEVKTPSLSVSQELDEPKLTPEEQAETVHALEELNRRFGQAV